MGVVGFDIGNENCVVAVVKQRGIDVLLNDESKRETPSVICFGEKQRFLGSAGAASAIMNPKSTVSQVKRLIGRKYTEPDIQNELKLFPVETSEGPDGGILVHFKYLGESHTFTPVQIMAMLFAHLKDITEKNLEMAISDCVIGIPSYFTDLQRRAYLNAAIIAGLKPLRLIHDCTATALSYGIYKTDLLSAGPTLVAFVDIGQCDTQDQYNIDVYSNVKACIRLRAACEKLKKVLSANAEAPLNIECLMDEKDVKGFIKREEFEKLVSGLLERICIPCNKALADAGLTAEKIHSVELVGSGSRIPAINRLLTSLFRREPSRTLNASECVARGCALQCAMLSPVFRVKEYEVQDSFPFSIGLSSDEGPVCVGSNHVLFPKGQPIPSVKILTFQRSNLFHLEEFYANLNELPAGASSKISCFTIGPFQGSHGNKARVKVRVQLNLHGILTIESATLIDDHVDNSVTKDDDHLSSDKMDADYSSETVANGNEGSTSRQFESSHTSVDGTRKNRATRRLDIPVSENIYGGMSKGDVSEAREKELQLAQQDRTMEQTKDKKNTLESYVYEMRNKFYRRVSELFNTYRSYASDQEREGISRSLQETEEWLYEDGDDETEFAYSSKLEDLRKMVNPIENRYKDEEARVQTTRDLLKCIADYRMSMDTLPARERELMLNECDKTEQWLREKTQQQDSLPKNSDPVLWSSDVKAKAEHFNLICQQILGSKGSPNAEGKGENK
ncbi:Heat shock 70 kDa protein [Quillaja saponaria]|uniref:Heat shock 70 kDa protein n=1 Tax=Quillaja saponaria TaxID=32244 RepID=A0AAD7PM85_QUISA|nr:Heat shock 70 kDa protein [Quillaja saponaria]